MRTRGWRTRPKVCREGGEVPAGLSEAPDRLLPDPSVPAAPGVGRMLYFPGVSCQGTRTFTRLRDTNLYEQDRQSRTVRDDPGLLPAPPGRGHRSLVPAADLLLLLPALRLLASLPCCSIFSLPGETEAGSAGEQPAEG